MYLFIKSIIFIFVFDKKRSIIPNLLELENFFMDSYAVFQHLIMAENFNF